MKFWHEKGAWSSNKAKRRLATIVPEDVKSIAVIRHAALGDMILLRAFLFDLKRFFINAKVTLSLVSNYTYGAPEDMVDRIHVVNRSNKRGVSLFKQITKARELGYHDIIFDLAATSRSLWVCALNKAKLKVGFPYHLIQQYLIYDATVLRSDLRFEAEIMLDMLNVLGVKTSYPPNFCLPGKALQRAKPYIIYFTSASTIEKTWPAENFSQVIKQLSESYPQHEHVILEGIAKWESAEPLLKGIGDKENIEIIKAMELEQTIELLKGAALVISNDTGIRNLAIATETPTIGIFFSTVPFRYWPHYGNHDAVFNADGSMPLVGDVVQSAQGILNSNTKI